MGSNEFKFPVRYDDPEYQQNHRALFSGSIISPLEHVLQPGVSQEAFDHAMADFKEIVGEEYTFIGQALEDYVDPYELWEKEGKRKMPSAAVWQVLDGLQCANLTIPSPSSVEELRRVLEVANTFGIPVWTFSRGKNLGYGDVTIEHLLS